MWVFFMLLTRNKAYAAAKWRASTAVASTISARRAAGNTKGGSTVNSSVFGFFLDRTTLEKNPFLSRF
jgi:hypothetical protein